MERTGNVMWDIFQPLLLTCNVVQRFERQIFPQMQIEDGRTPVTLVQSSSSLTSHAITAAVAAEQPPLQPLTQGNSTAFWELWTQYCTEGFERYSLHWMRGNQAD